MCNTELGKFCFEHDNWEELLQAEPYCLKVKKDSGYTMFSYDQIRSDFNEPVVREARGIIFRTGKWENPVCWAFNKFGNYGESYAPNIDWSTAFVTEKVDGSLIKLWWDEGDWWISTNGTIDAFKALTGEVKYRNFGSYFYATVCDYYRSFDEFLLGLNKDLTYMFELVGPYNRVVVPYDEAEIFFLGARDKFTGEEYLGVTENKKALGVDWFRIPKVYSLNTLEACLNMANDFDWNQEGFVVCDTEFNRVKIKSPAYVMAHYMRNNTVVNRKHLLKIILQNEIEEFLCCASEYKEQLLMTKHLLDSFFTVSNKILNSCRTLRTIPRKTYADFVKTYPIIFHGMMFRNYDQDCTAEEYTSQWVESKWEVYLDAFEELYQKLFKQ